MLTLGEVADLIGAECVGDKEVTVSSIADIEQALP